MSERYDRFIFYCRCGGRREGVETVARTFEIRARFDIDHAGHEWGERIELVSPPKPPHDVAPRGR